MGCCSHSHRISASGERACPNILADHGGLLRCACPRISSSRMRRAQQAAVDALMELFHAKEPKSSILATINGRQDANSIMLAAFFEAILAYRHVKAYPDVEVVIQWSG